MKLFDDLELNSINANVQHFLFLAPHSVNFLLDQRSLQNQITVEEK